MRQFDLKIQAAIAAHTRACSKLQAATTAAERLAGWKASDAAWLARWAAMDEAAAAFAAERGWKVAKRFSIDALTGYRHGEHPAVMRIVDHAYYFKQGRYAVGILSMPYHVDEGLQLALLQVEELDQMSWHNPGKTKMVLITAPDRFLPDHLKQGRTAEELTDRVTNLARNAGGAA